MAPEFIAERQAALQVVNIKIPVKWRECNAILFCINLCFQKYLNIVLMNPILASSLPARSFVDPASYCQPFSGSICQLNLLI